MKQIGLGLLLIITVMHQASAQWRQQPSGTRNNLRDVAFYNAATGYAVGDGGVVLKTTNGGTNWAAVTSPDKSDIRSVTVIDSAAVMVTTSAVNGNAAIYQSANGGRSWRKVLRDLSSLYATATPDKTLYSVGSKLYSSNNYGRSWAAQQKLNATSSYKQIAFSDKNTGMAAGNISGVITYSADFLRTVDGRNWYNGYNLLFPNANGFSSFSAIAADSVLMFTNYYNRYMPGDSSQLILLHHFKLRNAMGTYYWFFDNTILVNSFPDVIGDCQFFSGGSGYAVSEGGAIYKILDLGKTITREYSSKTPLHAVFMLDKNNGFAAGDHGLIVKRGIAGVTENRITIVPVTVYPNPATDQVQVTFTLAEATTIRLQLTTGNGKVVLQQPAKLFNKGRQTVPVKLNNVQRGNYYISLINSKAEVIGTAQIMVAR